MASEQPKVNREQIGLDAQIKIELYFVGLIFTLLGLSMQTAKPRGDLADLVELLGWSLFLIAGVVALFRIRTMPMQQFGIAKAEMQIGLYVQARQSKDDDLAIRLNDEFKQLKNKIEATERRIRGADSFQIWIFVIGICCIFAARAATQVSQIPVVIRWLLG